MSRETDVRVARVIVDGEGDWILTISGTDIRQRLWNDRDLDPGDFPGNAMGHRMIGLGWKPDRRAMYGPKVHSTVESRLLNMRAGWREDGEKSWKIPCYPRDEVTG